MKRFSFCCGLLFLSGILSGMEISVVDPDESLLPTLFCDHSHSLGYHYLMEPLTLLEQTSKVLALKVDATRARRVKHLREAVEREANNRENFDFDKVVLHFNPFGTACGFKVPLCKQCLSPERCECEDWEDEPVFRECAAKRVMGALYRAQLNGDDNGTKPVKGSNGWHWENKTDIKIYKTFISSSVIQKIIKRTESIAESNGRPPKYWKHIYIPKEKELLCTYPDHPKPFIGDLFFTPHDDLALYELSSIASYERSLDFYGNHRIREFLLSSNIHEYPLGKIMHYPAFFSELFKRAPSFCNKDKVVIDADAMLREKFQFSDYACTIFNATINYPNLSQNNEFVKKLLPIARCAQIGGKKGDILDSSLRIYNQRNTRQYQGAYDFFAGNKILKAQPFGMVHKEYEYSYSSGDFNKGIPVMIERLKHYSIDEVNTIHDEWVNECSEKIIAPKTKSDSRRNTLLIEIRKKSDDQIMRLYDTSTDNDFSSNPKCTYELTSVPDLPTLAEPNIITNELAVVAAEKLYILNPLPNFGQVKINQSNSVALLEEKEKLAGYKVDSLYWDKHNTIRAHLTPITLLEHFFNPVKYINFRSLNNLTSPKIFDNIRSNWKFNYGILNPLVSLKALYTCIYTRILRKIW